MVASGEPIANGLEPGVRQALGDAGALVWVLGEHGLEEAAHVAVDARDEVVHVPVQYGLCLVVRQPAVELAVVPSLLLPLVVPRPEHWLEEDGLEGAHADAPYVHQPGHGDADPGLVLALRPSLGELRRHVLRREGAVLQPHVHAGLHGAVEVDELPLVLPVLAEPHDVLRLDVHVDVADGVQTPDYGCQGPLQFPQLLHGERLAVLPVVPQPVLQRFLAELQHKEQQMLARVGPGTAVIAAGVVQEPHVAALGVDAVQDGRGEGVGGGRK
mmetsp:Transcript_92817/g.289386  ORF Transcript_92817/g.289386 Transcript_92817/m.289386 type:complete len:271 (+) Transcript_92817:226-1038(+)